MPAKPATRSTDQPRRDHPVGFRNSHAGGRGGVEASRAAGSCRARGSAVSVEVLADELDRADVVAAAVPKHPAERLVEFVDVGAVETAVVSDMPFEFERHLVYEAEGASARGLRDPNLVACACRKLEFVSMQQNPRGPAPLLLWVGTARETARPLWCRPYRGRSATAGVRRFRCSARIPRPDRVFGTHRMSGRGFSSVTATASSHASSTRSSAPKASG
jgi:hypothetical protein